MVSGGSYAVISMFDPATGFELYSTDGTTAGTVLLRDINPGTASSFPNGFARSGNRVFFAADNGVNGNELWVTDGTSANTKLVRDIVPGVQGSDPSSITEVGTLLLVGGFSGGVVFNANTAAAGTEPWISDGNAVTQILNDINPGTNSSGAYDFKYSANAFNVGFRGFVFTADNGINANEPWGSNGITTLMLKDVNPSLDSSSNPRGFAPISPFGFVFSADDGTNGNELWFTSNTGASTFLLKNINTSSGSGSLPASFLAFSSTKVLFLAADDGGAYRLWSTDGTAGGTSKLTESISGAYSFVSDFEGYPPRLVKSGANAYVACTIVESGNELCGTNGNQVFLTRDLKPGVLSSSPGNLTDLAGTLFFSADSGSEGREL